MSDLSEQVQIGKNRREGVDEEIKQTQKVVRKWVRALVGLAGAVLFFIAITNGLTVYKLNRNSHDNHAILLFIQDSTNPKGVQYKINAKNQGAVVDNIIACVNNHSDILAGKNVQPLKTCP